MRYAGRGSHAAISLLRRPAPGKGMSANISRHVLNGYNLGNNHMRYLHTMVRVSDLESSLDFYCNKLGLKEVRRMENEKGRFTLVFLATPEDAARTRAVAVLSLSLGSTSPDGWLCDRMTACALRRIAAFTISRG